MDTYNIRQSPESVRLARELISIARNVEFGDVRADMVTSRIIKETENITTDGMVEFVARLMGALELVLFTVEVLADDIARDAAKTVEAQALADHPQFKQRLEAMAREHAALRDKPLRRLAIVDDQTAGDGSVTVAEVAQETGHHPITVGLALSDRSLHGERTSEGWVVSAPCAEAWARNEKCAHHERREMDQ